MAMNLNSTTSLPSLLIEDPLATCTDGHLNDVALAAFVASSSDPDTLRYDEAMMRDVDALEWRESMHKEITSLAHQTRNLGNCLKIFSNNQNLSWHLDSSP
jgi:hypothetical protein